MQAVILAAGRGTRLRPLTDKTPKPMLEVGGRPILEYILSSLPDEIEKVLIVVEHLREQIENHFGKNFAGKKIIYVPQGQLKGTYGALFSAKDHLGSGKFLTLGGDDLHDKEELGEMISKDLAFGIARRKRPSKNFFTIEYQDGKLLGFRRSTDAEEIIDIATGAYVLDERLWGYPKVRVGGDEYGLPQTISLMLKNHEVAVIDQKKWFQINTPEDLRKAEKEVRRRKLENRRK